MEPITISVGMVWIIYAVAVLISVVASIVLHFHWKSYGMGNSRVTKGEKTYFAGIFFLLTLALVFAVIFTIRS